MDSLREMDNSSNKSNDGNSEKNPNKAHWNSCKETTDKITVLHTNTKEISIKETKTTSSKEGNPKTSIESIHTNTKETSHPEKEEDDPETSIASIRHTKETSCQIKVSKKSTTEKILSSNKSLINIFKGYQKSGFLQNHSKTLSRRHRAISQHAPV